MLSHLVCRSWQVRMVQLNWRCPGKTLASCVPRVRLGRESACVDATAFDYLLQLNQCLLFPAVTYV